MSEETLKKETPDLTFAGRILMALSPVEIPRETVLFYVDKPGALKSRAEAFARRPTIVQVIGKRLDPCRGLASLIEASLGGLLDIYAIDTILMEYEQGLAVHNLADIIVVDSGPIYVRLMERLDEMGVKPTVLYVTDDMKYAQRDNVEVLAPSDSTLHDALVWIGERQLEKVTRPIRQQFEWLTTGRRPLDMAANAERGRTLRAAGE